MANAVNFGVIVICSLYVMVDRYDRAKQSHGMLLCSFALGQFFALAQQFGILGNVSIEFEIRLLRHARFAVSELLLVNCVGSMSPTGKYVMKVCIILICLAIGCVRHALLCSYSMAVTSSSASHCGSVL